MKKPKLLLPAKTADLDKQQLAWLTFAELKKTTFAALAKDELAIQQILDGYQDVKDLKKIQDMIAKAKSLAAESKERRLYLTGTLNEKITQPAMLYEKRNDTLISSANAIELTLRKAESEKQNKEFLKAKEVVNFKAHTESEWFRIAAKYRAELDTLVLDSYKNALQTKVSKNGLKKYKEAIVGFLKDVKLDVFVKFEPKYLSKEEMKGIFNSLHKYDKKNDLADAIKKIDEVFEMYESDLKNKTKAIKAVDNTVLKVSKNAKKEIEMNTEITRLASEAEPLVLTGGPLVKEKLEVVEENSAEWAFNVISSFMAKIEITREHIRVGSWSKLTVGQMAAAIAKVGQPKLFPKLTFKVIEK